MHLALDSNLLSTDSVVSLLHDLRSSSHPNDMPSFSEILHTLQAVCSAYGTYLSYRSIASLRKYEEKSEKAAKWSNTAEQQLYKTRITQASGLGAVSVPIRRVE